MCADHEERLTEARKKLIREMAIKSQIRKDKLEKINPNNRPKKVK